MDGSRATCFVTTLEATLVDASVAPKTTSRWNTTPSHVETNFGINAFQQPVPVLPTFRARKVQILPLIVLIPHPMELPKISRGFDTLEVNLGS